jgi:phosphoribosyl-ATP pyrophosphohydrolase
MIRKLFSIVEEQKSALPEDSYTAQLIAKGEDTILRKISEETTELILSVKGEGDQRVIEESADLYYHLVVLLASRSIYLEDIEEELERRHKLD